MAYAAFLFLSAAQAAVEEHHAPGRIAGLALLRPAWLALA
jgi:hypothetical protein